MRAKYPHAFFYTEANGPYAAKGHEYRYNYDTHWLFPALTPIVDPRGGPAATQNLLSQGTLSWPDAARWLEELRATSPKGMTIVFQTDSHDSAEWCGFMGGQYNCEAYGPQMHRVLFALMNFMDGALMSLYGAQKGNEAFYSQLAALCREPIMAQGECDYTGATANNPESAVVAWRHGSALRVYVGNLENRAKTITLRLPVAKGHYRATERLCGRSSISFAGNQFSFPYSPATPWYGISASNHHNPKPLPPRKPMRREPICFFHFIHAAASFGGILEIVRPFSFFTLDSL